ncbi:MAG TPA: hypothetical protein PK513_03120 [Alphaproteobacteria bacterium]|nr:hypothetical protein [Alphaproteobacteria bacterium]USO06273.1 MAG: hypothetical protein H6859_03515 [Rhodospirillales bacterium]HOO81477.1 hypothetical protein [Alphaproteobacteria bacterium]
MDLISALFPTLFAKTFFILGTQLFVTWLAAKATLSKFRQLHDWGTPWITSTTNENRHRDLHVDWKHVATPFYALLIVNFAAFLLLLFWGVKQPLSISFGLFD